MTSFGFAALSLRQFQDSSIPPWICDDYESRALMRLEQGTFFDEILRSFVNFYLCPGIFSIHGVAKSHEIFIAESANRRNRAVKKGRYTHQELREQQKLTTSNNDRRRRSTSRFIAWLLWWWMMEHRWFICRRSLSRVSTLLFGILYRVRSRSQWNKKNWQQEATMRSN